MGNIDKLSAAMELLWGKTPSLSVLIAPELSLLTDNSSVASFQYFKGFISSVATFNCQKPEHRTLVFDRLSSPVNPVGCDGSLPGE